MYLYFEIDDFEQFYKGKSVFHLHIYTHPMGSGSV